MAQREIGADPYLAFAFRIELNGILSGAFSEVSGLQVEIETEDYREGGLNGYIHKLAGPARYPSNLILKHGILDADVLWQWQQATIEGAIDRQTLSVILLDSALKPTWQWTVRDAYPVKWSGPDLRGNANEVAVETLELAHRGISKK
jgi:phage tail-like protein